jgi:hypothetical protein
LWEGVGSGMSHCYPSDDSRKSLYYVEFERGDKKGEFTLFRRQWLYSEAELAEWEKKDPKHIFELRMCNEVHPWNLFTGGYGPLGTVPDSNWVCWMVDCLNLVSNNKDLSDRMWQAKLDAIASKQAKCLADEIDAKILQKIVEDSTAGSLNGEDL